MFKGALGFPKLKIYYFRGKSTPLVRSNISLIRDWSTLSLNSNHIPLCVRRRIYLDTRGLLHTFDIQHGTLIFRVYVARCELR